MQMQIVVHGVFMGVVIALMQPRVKRGFRLKGSLNFLIK